MFAPNLVPYLEGKTPNNLVLGTRRLHNIYRAILMKSLHLTSHGCVFQLKRPPWHKLGRPVCFPQMTHHRTCAARRSPRRSSAPRAGERSGGSAHSPGRAGRRYLDPGGDRGGVLIPTNLKRPKTKGRLLQVVPSFPTQARTARHHCTTEPQ